MKNTLRKCSTMLAAALITLSVAPLATAQNQANKNKATDTPNESRRFWEANVSGGSYMVALDRISSVSLHNYYVKGHLVHEVVIETSGSAIARFYAFGVAGEKSELNLAKNAINRAKDLTELAGKRAGVDTNTAVTKEYGTTTHAKTIEYHLAYKSDLDKLFQSVKRAWKDNKGRKFNIR